MAAVYGAALAAVLIWASTAVVTRSAVAGFDPLLLVAMRCVLTGLAAAPLVWVMGLPRPRGQRQLSLLLVSGVGGVVLFPLLFTLGLRYTTAGRMGLIQAAQSIFTGLIAAAIARRSPGPRWLVGCVIAGVGEIALIGARYGLDGNGSLLGDCIGILGALIVACAYVAGSHLSRHVGVWATSLWSAVVGGALALPGLVYLGVGVDWAAVGWKIWASVAFLSLGSSIASYLLWYWALTKGGVTRISALLFGQPLATVLLAVVLLGEPLTLSLALSGLVILAGVALAQRR